MLTLTERLEALTKECDSVAKELEGSQNPALVFAAQKHKNASKMLKELFYSTNEKMPVPNVSCKA